MSDHYVYVIAHTDADSKWVAPCKVGISATPGARLATLQSGNPTKLGVVFQFMVPDREIARSLERAFHRVFATHRLEGEWFDMHPIKAMTGMCANLEAAMKTLVGDDPDLIDEGLSASGVFAARQIAEEWLKSHQPGTVQ